MSEKDFKSDICQTSNEKMDYFAFCCTDLTHVALTFEQSKNRSKSFWSKVAHIAPVRYVQYPREVSSLKAKPIVGQMYSI